MKKAILLLLTAATAATVLTGCSPNTPDLSMPTDDRARTQVHEVAPEPTTKATPSINLTFHKSALPGGFRRLYDRTGVYTTEYIHFSPFDKPETMPNYSLELKDDGTYSFHADVNGVQSEHYGNYYFKHGGLILFYDEPMDTPAHNVYVADSIYMEMLPQGKIMFYDECGTIVLSKPDGAIEQPINSSSPTE